MNPRVISLSQSSTLKITALTKKLKKEGKDVVNFAAGEPDFDTPSFIKDAAIAALKEGFTKYTPSRGVLELREKIAQKLRYENNLPYEDKNIIVTTGAKYAIFVALFGLIEAGRDEVIIPSPYWVSYPEMAKLAGAKAQFLEALREDNFKISPEKLDKAITPKTKALILNYPSNPTGATYTREELQAIYEIVKNRGIFVISDEIYEKLVYDGREHISFASFSGAADWTITINGFSKTYSMTGWRVGYLAAPQSFADEFSKMIDHTTSCICSISQKAAIAALDNPSWPIKINQEFQRRRDILWQGLSKCDKVKPIKPEGTFYMFCDIRETGLSSVEFSSKLLEKYLVSCIPADAFGAEGFIRLSFSTAEDNIIKGIDRIISFVKEL